MLIKRARALVNVINTGTHRAQLQRIAGHFSFKYVAPQLDGETRVPGVAVMFRSLLVLRLLLHEYAIAKPELLRTVMLTDVEWAQLAELLAIVEKVEDFNTMVQVCRDSGNSRFSIATSLDGRRRSPTPALTGRLHCTTKNFPRAWLASHTRSRKPMGPTHVLLAV